MSRTGSQSHLSRAYHNVRQDHGSWVWRGLPRGRLGCPGHPLCNCESRIPDCQYLRQLNEKAKSLLGISQGCPDPPFGFQTALTAFPRYPSRPAGPSVSEASDGSLLTYYLVPQACLDGGLLLVGELGGRGHGAGESRPCNHARS
jgi:hypothetical protein